MSYVVPSTPVTSVPVVGTGQRFPVHRVYCVGRNYEEHAKEMGFTGREPPFFFLKPADTVVPVNAGETGSIAYPSLTQNLHHEIELVVAIGTGGRNIKAADAMGHVFGYAAGLDMTVVFYAEEPQIAKDGCVHEGFVASRQGLPMIPALAETIAIADMPMIPIYYYVSKNLVSQKVIGWKDTSRDIHRIRWLDLAS
mgnify:CR=1 FL=1